MSTEEALPPESAAYGAVDSASVKELFEIVESGKLHKVKEFISAKGISANVTNKVNLKCLRRVDEGV